MPILATLITQAQHKYHIHSQEFPLLSPWLNDSQSKLLFTSKTLSRFTIYGELTCRCLTFKDQFKVCLYITPEFQQGISQCEFTSVQMLKSKKCWWNSVDQAASVEGNGQTTLRVGTLLQTESFLMRFGLVHLTPFLHEAHLITSALY